jgi:hypothetical protein
MTHARLHLAAAFATVGLVFAAPALAQSNSCEDGQKILVERQSLIKQFQALGGGAKKKPVDARVACTIFTKLVSNGDKGIKWMEANKDWCQVPDQIVTSFKSDQSHVTDLKGKACGAAAKMAQMEKQAREAQKNGGGGGGLLGGGGLTGTYKIPQGAL